MVSRCCSRIACRCGVASAACSGNQSITGRSVSILPWPWAMPTSSATTLLLMERMSCKVSASKATLRAIQSPEGLSSAVK